MKSRDIFRERKKQSRKPVLQLFAGFLCQVFLQDRAENEVERR